MFTRFLQRLRQSSTGSAWLFVGVPSTDVFHQTCTLLQGHLHLTPEAFFTDPDIFILHAPEEKTVTGRQRAISVAQVRDACERLILTSLTGKKYLLIPGADALSEAAQNALLKLIEDPVGIMTAVLFVEDEQSLGLPLRSRLAVLRLPRQVPALWEYAAESPEAFVHASLAERMALIERLVQHAKGDVDHALSWLVGLQALAASEGRGALLLAVAAAWEGISAQGNVHAQLTTLIRDVY